MKTYNLGTWSLVAVLTLFLAAAVVFAYQGMTVHGEFTMPEGGEIALGVGVFFSLVVGIGLMGLMFYSSRAGYDEPAHVEPQHQFDSDESKSIDADQPGSSR